MSARLVRVSTTKASCDIPSLIRLRAGDTLTFGRNKSSDVVLDSTVVSAMISRTHAKVVFDAASGTLHLFDLNSTNGVYKNDRKIDVSTLADGDRITFGGRGKSIPIGQVDPQPASEFIYELRVDEYVPGSAAALAAGAGSSTATGAGGGDEEPSTFELLKTLTDNVQLLLTWATCAFVAASYLFAEPGSEEYSFAASYVAPVFDLLHVPFNRATFTCAFVLAVAVGLGGGLWLLKRGNGNAAAASNSTASSSNSRSDNRSDSSVSSTSASRSSASRSSKRSTRHADSDEDSDSGSSARQTRSRARRGD